MKIEQIETDKNRIDYITLNLTRKIYIGKPVVANERIFQEIIAGNSHLLEDLEAKTPSSFRKYGMLMEAKEIVSA